MKRPTPKAPKRPPAPTKHPKAPAKGASTPKRTAKGAKAREPSTPRTPPAFRIRPLRPEELAAPLTPAEADDMEVSELEQHARESEAPRDLPRETHDGEELRPRNLARAPDHRAFGVRPLSPEELAIEHAVTATVPTALEMAFPPPAPRPKEPTLPGIPMPPVAPPPPPLARARPPSTESVRVYIVLPAALLEWARTQAQQEERALASWVRRLIQRERKAQDARAFPAPDEAAE